MKIFLFFIPLVYCQTLLIDPGHGGEDSGAIGIYNGKEITEKKIALIYSLALQKELKKNYKVYLTRDKDEFVSLEERALYAKQIEADAFLSIHFNSGSEKSRGLEIYSLGQRTKMAKEKFLEHRHIESTDPFVKEILVDLVLEASLKNSNMLAKNIYNTLMENMEIIGRGVKKDYYYVLALSQRPSLLIEVGFLTNKKDLALILSDEFMDQFVNSIKMALKSYFKGIY